MKALTYEGNITSDRNKARMDYIKLNLMIDSSEVFGTNAYGHEFLNIKDDGSIISAIQKITSSMVNGMDLAISGINRKVQGVVSITFKGDNQNEITIEDNYGSN